MKEEEEIDMSVYDRLYKVEVYTGEAGINANVSKNILFLYLRSPEGEGGGILFYLCPSVLPSVQDIFHRIFLSNYQWQKSDIWSQASYRYAILWVAFLDPSDSYFLFADLVGFYTH